MSFLKRKRNKFQYLLIAFVYPLLFCIANVEGLRVVHGDAKHYLIMAQGFIEHGLEYVVSMPYSSSPPLYSIFLAIALKLLSTTPSFSALYMHTGLLLVFGYRMLKDYLPSPVLFQFFFVFGLLFSHQLFKVNMEALSETSYITCVAFGFWTLHKYKDTSKWWYLVLLIAVASMASLLRYVGVIFIMVVFCYFLIQKKQKTAFTFLIGSVFLLSLWLLRNYVLFQVITGKHTHLLFTSLEWQIIPWILDDVGQWISPFIFLKLELINAGFSLLFVIFLGFLIWKTTYFRKLFLQSYLPETLYVVFYLGLIVALIRPSGYPYVFMRVLLPILPYVVLAYLSVGSYFYQKNTRKPFLKAFIAGLYSLWVIQILRNTLTHLWVRYFDEVHFSLLDFIKTFF